MLAEEMCPFARFARRIEIDENTGCDTRIAYDARLFYAAEGEGTVYADGKPFAMTPGAVLVIAAGCPYRLASEKGRRAAYLAVNFDYTQTNRAQTLPVRPARPGTFERERVTEQAAFEDAPALNGVLYLTDMYALRAPLEAMEREYRCRLTGWRVKVNALLGSVLADCLRGGQAGSGQGRLREVLDYIHEDPGRPMTNASLAARFGYHPNHLSSLFVRWTGVPLHRYLIRVRLEAAARLLSETDSPVGEIARATGFDSASSFTAAFRKNMGCTPGQYRGGA